LVPVDHDVPTQDPQFPTAGRLKLYEKVARRVQVPKQTLTAPDDLASNVLDAVMSDTIGAVLVLGGSNRVASRS